MPLDLKTIEVEEILKVHTEKLQKKCQDHHMPKPPLKVDVCNCPFQKIEISMKQNVIKC